MSPTKQIEHLKIALRDILLSTDYFAEEKLIAKGGFGTVYKGQSEQHGTIAVKRLNTKSGQGYKEFMTEVNLLSHYKHENIVSLVGFCDEKGMNILVYKYESKGSLDKHINSKDLTWIQRLRICIDAASGLKYLHEDVGPQHRIIHRDVKSANILLDENWKAKISDFGLSKQTPANVELSMVISHPCGTMGYIAPEYVNDKILTKESDVFSFGVVLFEVLCGRPACVSKPPFLYELARKHYKEGTLLEIVDSTVQNQMVAASIKTFSSIAFRCLCEEEEKRPLMSEVVNELKKALEDQRMTSKISSMPSTSEPTLDDADTQDIFMSRQFIYKAALESLDPKNKTQKLALCGMGGVGKTTMMEKLEEAVTKKKMFDKIMMVVIGKNPDPIALQQGIADYMPEPLKETHKEARSRRLKKMFLEMSQNGTKNILIVLDDVWEAVDLKDIGLAPLLPKGFKLLLTSRYEKVCSQMYVEDNFIFKMVGLDDAEARDLFWNTVRLSDEDCADGELREIGEDILKTCGGLPIAIKTIASALTRARKAEWMLTRNRLQVHNFTDVEGLYEVVNDIFRVSLKNLKEVDEAIFVLSGLFPEDFDIPLEELMMYGWGLQLFGKVDSLAEARLQTKTSVDKLINANLLSDSSKIGRVKMHDLARAFVLSDISEFKQASIVNHGDKKEWPIDKESCERILLNCAGMSEFSHDFNYPKLALLKLTGGKRKMLKFPDDFYERMGKLEVIAYDTILYPLLPKSLQCSTSLRTLCLSSCSLPDDTSFLGDLVSLEVLSLANCGIRKLPSTIRKLIKLRLLDLTWCVDLCIDDKVFQSLGKLEELYMGVSRFRDSNCEEFYTLSGKLFALEFDFFTNKAQPKCVSFEKLELFNISMGCSLKYNADLHSFKNTLALVTSRNELLECKMNELFKKTEILTLKVDGMNHLEEILTPPRERSFCNLKEFVVSKCKHLTHLLTVQVANGMKNLERLKVSSCPVLESLLVNDEGGVITFPKLKLLLLDDLPKLVSSCDTMELPQLLELKLIWLPNFTSIFARNNDNISSKQPLLNKKVAIRKLEKLEIRKMTKLKEIWSCRSENEEEVNINDISMLREIYVYGCDRIVNLFPSNPMRLLSHLEELRVGSCGSVEVLFNIEMGKSEQLNSNSSLRSIYVDGLRKLREVWRIKDAKINSHHLCFSGVESIRIYECEKFRNVFTPTTTHFDLGALEVIDIFDCGEEFWNSDEELVEINQEEEEEEVWMYSIFNSSLLRNIF